jgi:hypothetical protein
MADLNVNSIGDASGGNTATINSYTPTESNMAGRNRIINGDMRIAQRGTSATVSDGINEGYSTIDRWYVNMNNTISGAVTFSQSSDAPSGFASSAKIQCSTTNTSLSTNQYLALQQRIEAFELQSLGYGTADAKPITVSWYMKTETYAGPISVSFYTSDGTVEYFTVSKTPTTSWVRYSVTIPGSTSATINNDNGLGMTLQFVVAGDSGSSIAAASDSTAWSSTRADYRSNVGNILSSTSNAFYITGVQLEAGSVATPFEHRMYGQELALCQRYYYRDDNTYYINRGYGSEGYPHISWKQTMRATPTVTYSLGYATSDGISATVNGLKGYIISAWSTTPSIFNISASAEL